MMSLIWKVAPLNRHLVWTVRTPFGGRSNDSQKHHGSQNSGTRYLFFVRSESTTAVAEGVRERDTICYSTRSASLSKLPDATFRNLYPRRFRRSSQTHRVLACEQRTGTTRAPRFIRSTRKRHFRFPVFQIHSFVGSETRRVDVRLMQCDRGDLTGWSGDQPVSGIRTWMPRGLWIADPANPIASSAYTVCGTIRWISPELLTPDQPVSSDRRSSRVVRRWEWSFTRWSAVTFPSHHPATVVMRKVRGGAWEDRGGMAHESLVANTQSVLGDSTQGPAQHPNRAGVSERVQRGTNPPSSGTGERSGSWDLGKRFSRVLSLSQCAGSCASIPYFLTRTSSQYLYRLVRFMSPPFLLLDICVILCAHILSEDSMQSRPFIYIILSGLNTSAPPS